MLNFGCGEGNVRNQSSSIKLAHETLKSIYDKKDIGSNRGMEYEVYLSVWEVGSDARETVHDLIDILISSTKKKSQCTTSQSFKALQIPTLKHATSILSNLPNLITEKGHVFFRVILKSYKFNVCSALHFVDVVSSSEGGGGGGGGRKKKETSALQRQHHCLSKIMKGLSSESGKEGGEGVLLSASRESKLTQILGPLLSGNCRTWFLGFLSKGEGKGGECMETLKVRRCICLLRI